ncbi:hypothetical protein FE257_011129 [Aspergillus nanangensis]|uniref:Acyltransferase 3 domain-containing protein n=1 Tax=Aspergillus nanangensis TaxID=2582783 RepID=A0AAD4GRN8_ASPNN|nr:hypothetical protein FE257_011129 [Aspergillus nanangensis]
MDRTTWLDGLRGIAAAVVAFDHYFMGGVLDVAFRSFWADPPEENRRLIQLPPIRVLFASHAMVSLFFVISGYAISINLLRARNQASRPGNPQGSDFLRRLSSAATRRIFRIYLPVFVIAVLTQILFFCGVYHWHFDDGIVWGRRPWTAPFFHLTYLGRYCLDIMNIIQFHDNPGLNGQLWTMPLEFRGSCVIYLTVLALASWKPTSRRGALIVMMGYWFYYGLWDIVAFLAGLYLAEGKIASPESASSSQADEEVKLLLPLYISHRWTKHFPAVDFSRLRVVFSFVFGLYLICLSDDGHLPPGYQFLRHLQSSRWDDEWSVVHRSWKAVGSVLLVYAIGKSSLLQRPFNSAPVQYLGRISFSLYLIHQAVYRIAREPVRNFIWWLVTREDYATVENASSRVLPFAFSWMVTLLIMGAAVVYLADLFTRFVDVKSVLFAKRFEKLVSR